MGYSHLKYSLAYKLPILLIFTHIDLINEDELNKSIE